MGKSLQQWRERARALLGSQDKTTLIDDDLESHVFSAVYQFSVDHPRVVYYDYTGDGTTFKLVVPATWVPAFSTVDSVEYPQGQRPPQYLDVEEVQPYPTIDAPVELWLNYTTPAIGKVARVYFTVPWPLPDANPATDAIGPADFEAVAQLCAGWAAEELAGRASGNKRFSMPSADSTAFETEEDRWLKLAARKIAFYQNHVGANQGPAPAGGQTDWDLRSTWILQGRRFVYHRTRQ